MPLHEFEHAAIHDRPQRLHKIEHKTVLASELSVEKPDSRIKADTNNLRSNIIFENRISVVQHRIEGMCGALVPPMLSIADQ